MVCNTWTRPHIRGSRHPLAHSAGGFNCPANWSNCRSLLDFYLVTMRYWVTDSVGSPCPATFPNVRNKNIRSPTVIIICRLHAFHSARRCDVINCSIHMFLLLLMGQTMWRQWPINKFSGWRWHFCCPNRIGAGLVQTKLSRRCEIANVIDLLAHKMLWDIVLSSLWLDNGEQVYTCQLPKWKWAT